MIHVSPSQNWAPASVSWLHDEAALDAHRQMPARLAAVQASGLDDATARPALDDLTRLAARLLGASASFVALLLAQEDRYVSHTGLPPPLADEARCGGRSLCHYTLAASETLVIEDTTAHAPWRQVPSVGAIGGRAYIGVPLRLDGQVIGSFCVIDQQPRAWTALQIDTVQQLAASAERDISLRFALGRERQQATRTQRRARERAQSLVALAQEVQAPMQALQLCCLQLTRQAAALPASAALASLAQRLSEATGLMRDSLARNLRPTPRQSDPALHVAVPLDELAHAVLALVQPLAALRDVGLVLQLGSPATARLDYAQALRLVLHLCLHALEQAVPGQQVVLSSVAPPPAPATGLPAWRWAISAGSSAAPAAGAEAPHWEPLASDRQDLLDHARHQGLSLRLSAVGQPFEAVLHWGLAAPAA